MDRFEKNALIGLVVMSAIVLIFFYVGIALGNIDIAGTDGKVEGQAAESGNKEALTVWYQLDELGENVGFLLAGVFGGLVAGYLWPMVFEEPYAKGAVTRG